MSVKFKHYERIDSLILKKATGTPKQLAKKLNLSETYVKRLIGEMRKTHKMPIKHFAGRGYLYERKGHFFVGFLEDEWIIASKNKF
ncbi:MAG TPA: hypothetical protein VKB19_15530 [Pedobacter sp.]|nr:hypothetical protein [Pedobacter sp.]